MYVCVFFSNIVNNIRGIYYYHVQRKIVLSIRGIQRYSNYLYFTYAATQYREGSRERRPFDYFDNEWKKKIPPLSQ